MLENLIKNVGRVATTAEAFRQRLGITYFGIRELWMFISGAFTAKMGAVSNARKVVERLRFSVPMRSTKGYKKAGNAKLSLNTLQRLLDAKRESCLG